MRDLIKAEALTKVFRPEGFRRLSRAKTVTAVDRVSFSIAVGECFGLVGESGCGKSTMGRLLLKLTEPTSGKVFFNGANLGNLSPHEIKKLRPRMQMVYQDADNSLDPRYSVYGILEEPLRLKGLRKSERQKRIRRIMSRVNIGAELMLRHSHELSGGQRQRVGIARALLQEPDFIVADEPAASLDMSVQAQMLQLLDTTKRTRGTALLYISHNLRMVRFMSKRMAVMYLGGFLETGITESIFHNPLHPYTRMLFASLLCSDPRERRKNQSNVAGESPDPAFIPPGCAFHPRCSLRAPLCEREKPPLRDVGGGRKVACHTVRSSASAGNPKRIRIREKENSHE